MKRKWTTPLFVILVTLVPVGLAVLVTGFQQRYQQLPVLGDPETPGLRFSFTDQGGSVFSERNCEGRIVVANYFFTHCPVVCPKMLYNLKELKTAPDLIICSFTVDPERDSVWQLALYADRFKLPQNWKLLTGDKKELYRLARNQLKLVATEGDGGPLDFIHSENLILLDQLGRIRGYYRGTDSKEMIRLQEDIEKLRKSKA